MIFDIFKRTIKTMIQTALGFFGVSTIYDVDWVAMLGAVIISGLSCVLMNVVVYLGDEHE